MMKKRGSKLTKKEIKDLQKQMPELPNKKYHCICDNCNFSWYDYEDYNIQTHCPRCLSGEVYVYGEDDDNF